MIEARGNRGAIVRAYDLFSYVYSSTAARLERAGVNRGLERLRVRPGDRVLEVAVGTAVVHARLRARVGHPGRLIGVDLSPGMLRATRRRLPDARLARADARRLPFGAETFDALWSSYLLDLIPTAEITPVLVEFHRVLRVGGQLVLVNFSKNQAGPTLWERCWSESL
jgi:demethylmenaquinone methyltransferase/2-methoxy-6-polyprenyl-1,4-benzoquinol methylase